MSKVASRIIRRGSKLYYRRRVPDDVRAAGGFGCREHHQVSLRTSSEVEARHKAAQIDADFERVCGEARGLPAPIAVSLRQGDLVLTDEYLRSLQDRHVASSIAFEVGQEFQAQRSPDLQAWLDDQADRDAPVYVLDAEGNVKDRAGTDARRRQIEVSEARLRMRPEIQMQAQAFGVAPGSPDYDRIEMSMIEAELRVLDAGRSRQPRMFGEAYRPADALGPQPKPESLLTLRALSERYLEVNAPGASWRHKVEVTVDLFEKFLGQPTPIAAISRDRVQAFLQLLRQCPERATMRFPGRSLQEAVEANKVRAKPFPRVSANTVRDTHYAVLRRLFGYATQSLGAIAHDPTSRIKIDGTTNKGGRRSHFEVEELQRLLALPWFVGCRSEDRTMDAGNVRLSDHRFWTPLIMLFSGARPSEIAQLSVTDARLDDRYPSFSILTEFDEDDPDERPFVLAFKTENARRQVPIHPTLIDLGFKTYVERIRRSGCQRLFPDWPASSDPRKLYSGATWVRRFNSKLVPLATSKKPKPSIYSLRHTFKTQMAICRVPPQFQDKILGHAGPAMDPTYLHGIPISALYEEIAKVSYAGLNLDPLRR